MNLRQMKYCLEIYHAGSFHKASQNLYLSQPALTQQLQRIEKELGVKIFNRDTKPISLTHEGELCISAFEKILFEFDRLNYQISDAKELENTVLTIGIPPVRAPQFLPLILPSFRSRFPHIRINYQEIPSSELPKALRNGSIDMALMIVEKYAEGFLFEPVCYDRPVLIAERLSPYGAIIEENEEAGKPFDFSCLKEVPFVLRPKGSHLREVADSVFEQYQIHPPVILEIRNVDMSVKLAALGECCAICGETYLYFSNEKNLKVVSASEEMYRLGIAMTQTSASDKAVRILAEFVKEICCTLPFSAVKE